MFVIMERGSEGDGVVAQNSITSISHIKVLSQQTFISLTFLFVRSPQLHRTSVTGQKVRSANKSYIQVPFDSLLSSSIRSGNDFFPANQRDSNSTIEIAILRSMCRSQVRIKQECLAEGMQIPTPVE